MFRGKMWPGALCAFALAMASCGAPVDETGDERGDLETLGAKADIPTWLKAVPANWGCDQTLKGSFVGADSAHLYSFPGKVGYEYTFAFKATYAASKGAVIAVYDSETGERVAYQKAYPGNQATVTYRAARSIKYLVGVYSIAIYATGSYTLSSACKVVLVTCQGDFACAKGQFCKFDKGCGKVDLGVCTAVPVYCTKQYSPVCGCDGKTYGNSCEAAAAAASIDYAGACTVKPAPVTVKTDKAVYKVGEAITGVITNGAAESIFLGGCSVFAWQKQESGKWVDQGPDKVCVWEGYGVELKAKATYKESLARDVGTWRLVLGYAVGCTPGKPLSQAACKASFTVTSNALEVRDCPMLAKINPATFCPKGKIVPRYDVDHICMTGFDCKACVVADCGPAMGMPNKLCWDGKTTSGPTGKCLGTDGQCGWEVLECPPQPKCQATGCSGQLCATTDIVTTCEYMNWYECYGVSQCGNYGSNGACGWNQTPAFLACMAKYGK